MLRLNGLNAEIQVDDPREFYTNGDTISGYMVVQTSKPLTVRNIEIKLRCEDFAYVWVPNGQGGYYEAETVRHLSMKHTLFPNHSIAHHGDKESRYTINSGEHKFKFSFQIPLGVRFPQSITIENSNSGIRWYLKGVVHRGQVLSAAKRAIHEFEMRPSLPLVYDGSHITTESSKSTMWAYLPGYAAQAKTPAGRFKDLFPSNSHFKKRVEVSLLMGLPVDGVLQAPSALPIQIDVSSPDEDLLVIRRFELELKVRYLVRVNNGAHSALHRDSLILVDLRTMNAPIKEGLRQIQDKISEATIKGRLPGSFINKHFDLSYKLAASMLVASRENPTAVEKLRVSVPILLHHILVRPSNIPNSMLAVHEYEDLPAYCEIPQTGELTFTNHDFL